MLHILWALLNLCILAVFFKAFYSTAVLLAGKIGRLSSFILIFGCASYACQNSDNENHHSFKKWENQEIDQVAITNSKMTNVIVEESLLSDYKINYVNVVDSLGNRMISQATFIRNGVSFFTHQNIEDFTIYSSLMDNKLQYFASVSEDWYILGLKVFTTYKTFRNS